MGAGGSGPSEPGGTGLWAGVHVAPPAVAAPATVAPGAPGRAVEPSPDKTWEGAGFAPWVQPAARRLRPVLPALGVYALMRACLVVADLLAAHIGYGTHPDGPLTAWDGHWYVTVATTWYPAHPPMVNGHLTYGAAAFEPVYPALIRAGEVLGFTVVQSALLVSIIAGAVAVVLVWWLAALLYGPRVAHVAAVLFATFPGMGVAWGMLYSECVGFPLVAGSLILMVKRRWVWAGVVGALASATNATALPLALAALVPVAQAIRRRQAPGALITVCLVPLGFVAFAGYLGLRYHDTLYWWHLQSQAWGGTIDFGRSLLNLLVHPLQGGYQGKGWMEWVGVVAVAGAVFALVKARPPLMITVYCAGVFVLLFASNSLGFKPRFLGWAFPALIAVAALTRRRGWQPIALTFAFVLPIVFLAYATIGNYMVQP